MREAPLERGVEAETTSKVGLDVNSSSFKAHDLCAPRLRRVAKSKSFSYLCRQLPRPRVPTRIWNGGSGRSSVSVKPPFGG